MGHKVNPTSFRLILKKDWQSKWFAKNYKDCLLGDIDIRRTLMTRFGKTTGVEKIEILRDQEAVKVVIHTSKPGVIIGRSGQGITDLKIYLMKKCPALRSLASSKSKQKIDIEIMEIKQPYLSAELVAQTIAYQIEKRIAYKRAIKQAIVKIMEAKAKGVKVGIAGRLNGAEIARREQYGQGSVPLGRLRAEIDFAKVNALTTYGIVGVKVWIYKGDRLEQEEA